MVFAKIQKPSPVGFIRTLVYKKQICVLHQKRFSFGFFSIYRAGFSEIKNPYYSGFVICQYPFHTALMRTPSTTIFGHIRHCSPAFPPPVVASIASSLASWWRTFSWASSNALRA
jgi:hypothetical protein